MRRSVCSLGTRWPAPALARPASPHEVRVQTQAAQAQGPTFLLALRTGRGGPRKHTVSLHCPEVTEQKSL